MEKQRFWVGLALIAMPFSCLFLLFLVPAPVVDDVWTEPVEGHVSIHGCPVTSGYIVFYPEDESSDPIAGLIDPDGHYEIGPRWLRNQATETRFRICLVPGHPFRSSGAPRDPDVLRTSGDAGARPSMPAREIERLRDPTTTNLEVRLGAQAAEVDVDL